MKLATADAARGGIEPVIFSTISIPPVNTYWPGQGGKFRGIVAGIKGQPDYLLVEFANELPQRNWSDAVAFVKDLEADGHKDFALPLRAEAELLAAYAKSEHQGDAWHWTGDLHQENFGYAWAWMPREVRGGQDTELRSKECRVCAVRRVPIPAP